MAEQDRYVMYALSDIFGFTFEVNKHKMKQVYQAEQQYTVNGVTTPFTPRLVQAMIRPDMVAMHVQIIKDLCLIGTGWGFPSKPMTLYLFSVPLSLPEPLQREFDLSDDKTPRGELLNLIRETSTYEARRKIDGTWEALPRDFDLDLGKRADDIRDVRETPQAQ